MSAPLKTFIIYARTDEAFKNQLLRHLRPLRSVSVWHDGNILPGEEWDTAIKRELKASELVLFLVSADSLNSDYIQSKELKTALELLRQGQARLVPIVVAPCAWKFDPIISGLQALPLFKSEGVKPVRSWQDTDEAWASVVEHLGDMVEEIQKKRAETAEEAERRRREDRERAEREKAETERQTALRLERERAEAQAALAALAAKQEAEKEAELRLQEETERQREAERRQRLAAEHARRDHDAFATATATNTSAAYDEYLRNFPAGLHEPEARQRRKDALRRERAGTASGYFSAKNIAVAVGLLTLGIFGVNYLWNKDEPKQDNTALQTPLQNANSAPAFDSTAPQKQPETQANTTEPAKPATDPPANTNKPERKPAYLEPAMADIPGGSFSMGSDEGDSDEKPVHTVRIRAFKLAKTEVTFEEYDLFCEATRRKKPADEGWGRGKRPVINVSWEDAKAYCAWLSTLTGRQYRLPTEAEWEYAAREGGSNVRFGNGKDIADPNEINFNGSANYKKDYSIAGQYRQKTVPVGSLRSPNRLGLHDMSGNVWEWCADWYHSNYSGAPADSSAWFSPAGSSRVLRGGSWSGVPQVCRVANRGSGAPGDRNGFRGFRLARTN